MTAALVFDGLLCLLLVAVAVLAVAVRDLFTAIAFFVACGILVALAWLRLGAVDVALAEVAIGAGLTGVLLIGAWSALRRRGVPDAAPRLPVRSRLAVGAASLAVTGLLGHAALALLGKQTEGLRPLVEAGLADTGLGNPVTGVLLGFRAWDTLVESMVLLVALVAVWALTPDSAWGGRPGLRHHARADGVLASFGRLLPPLGLLIAIYVVWVGSDLPGGAFQGGTILAAVWLLAMMAGLQRAPRVDSRAPRLLLVAGPATFLAIGTAGLLGGAFLGLPPALAKSLIVLIEFALALSIAATLALLVAGTPEQPG